MNVGLKALSENTAHIQKEIDDSQTAFKIEQRAFYPELLDEASTDEDELSPDDAQEEDEVIGRLRTWLSVKV